MTGAVGAVVVGDEVVVCIAADMFKGASNLNITTGTAEVEVGAELVVARGGVVVAHIGAVAEVLLPGVFFAVGARLDVGAAAVVTEIAGNAGGVPWQLCGIASGRGFGVVASVRLSHAGDGEGEVVVAQGLKVVAPIVLDRVGVVAQGLKVVGPIVLDRVGARSPVVSAVSSSLYSPEGISS